MPFIWAAGGGEGEEKANAQTPRDDREQGFQRG